MGFQMYMEETSSPRFTRIFEPSLTYIFPLQGNVFLFYNYICRKIMSNQLGMIKVQIGGGRLDYSVMSEVRLNNEVVCNHILCLSCIKTIKIDFKHFILKFLCLYQPQINSDGRNRFHHKEDSSESELKDVKVLVLKRNGDVLSWKSNCNSIDRCRYNYTQVCTFNHLYIYLFCLFVFRIGKITTY